MAVSAAFSLASNPFFCVPVSEEALTLAIRLWITACGVSTVTVNEHDAVLPLASVAVWVTVVVPIGKTVRWPHLLRVIVATATIVGAHRCRISGYCCQSDKLAPT